MALERACLTHERRGSDPARTAAFRRRLGGAGARRRDARATRR
jgi:hypothetical protein